MQSRLAQIFAELLGEVCAAGQRFARVDVEFGDAVEQARVMLGVGVALALGGMDVQKHGLFHKLCRFECIGQLLDIVSVHGTHVAKAHVLEQRTAVQVVFDAVFGAHHQSRNGLTDERNAVEQVFGACLEADILGLGADDRKVSGECADIAGNGHLVFVEDDNQTAVGTPGVVERLIDETARKRAVTDDRYGIAFVVVEPIAADNAVGVGDGSAGMSRVENIVFALVRTGKAGDTALLSQGGKAVIPSREQFVGIDLVTHVENELVLR